MQKLCFTLDVCVDARETIELCRRVEAAGASWITVHGRTTEQRGQPVNLEAIRMIKDCVHIPVIAKGDIRSLAEAEGVRSVTGVNGTVLHCRLGIAVICSHPSFIRYCLFLPIVVCCFVYHSFALIT